MDGDAENRGRHFGAEVVDLRTVAFTDEILGCVSGDLARRYHVLPVGVTEEMLTIAIADPSDLATIDALSQTLEHQLNLVVADESQIEAFVERLYDLGANG